MFAFIKSMMPLCFGIVVSATNDVGVRTVRLDATGKFTMINSDNAAPPANDNAPPYPWEAIPKVVRKVVPKVQPRFRNTVVRKVAPKVQKTVRPLFTSDTVDISVVSRGQDAPEASLTSICETRPCADDMPIIKHSVAAIALATNGLSELSVPGKMRSAPFYVVDVMALPRENSLAVFGLGEMFFPAAFDDVSLDKARRMDLTRLPMALLGAKDQHTLKCAILDESTVTPDIHSMGGNQILMCRAVGVDIGSELRQASRTRSQVLRVQLGSDVVNVSTQTLSAGTLGGVSRNYHKGESAGQSTRHLQASVVISVFGHPPAYMAETMKYYEMAGISHVYMGIYKQETLGNIRKQVEPFISSGFVSVMEIDAWPDFHAERLTSKVNVAHWETLINDWALYHAKSWDDLLLVNDYDELMVPTQGNTVPNVIENLLQQNDAVNLQDLCFIMVCSIVTYGDKGRAIEERGGQSRAEDFPFMDAGAGKEDDKEPALYSKGDPNGNARVARNRCERDGYTNIYPKSIAVVRTSYKTTPHLPGACSAFTRDPLNGEALGYHMNVARDRGLVVQHFTEMNKPGRFVNYSHKEQPSIFNKIWAPRLKQSRSA